MALRGWSWEAAVGPEGVRDRPLLEALQTVLPDEVVERAIEATATREQRRRLLPTHMVVTLVVAMGLWAGESMRHALAAVVDGWRERDAAAEEHWHLPCTAALVRARKRVGVRLLRVLFHSVAGPIATPQTPGAFLNGLRLMALDGTTLEVADTSANERAFGRPSTPRGTSAYPQVRLVEMIRATQARGADFLGRAKVNLIFEPTEILADGSFLAAVYRTPYDRLRRVGGHPVRIIEYALDTPEQVGRERYRLVTSLLDERAFPAKQLAAVYHERWEIETTLDEVKVHQWAHPKPLRSQAPREVVQEIYGLLLAHLAIRTMMHQAALRQGLDPDRLSFTGALRVLRRAIGRAQRTSPELLPLFLSAC